MSRWYRTHVGLVTDAKLGEAALIAENSRAVVIATWHAILESCAETQDAGRFDTTPRRVAAVLAEPVATIEGIFAAFASLGMIEAGCVVAWTRRQFESDSSTERVRKHREGKRSGEALRGHVVSTQKGENPNICQAVAGKRGDITTVDHVGNVSSSPVKRFETPPDTHSETETEVRPSPPLSPVPDCEPQAEEGNFDQFWQAMPSPNPSARAAAQAAFDRLNAIERGLAIAGAKRYAAAFADKPTTHPMSPVRFLRERCFLGYAPTSTPAAAPSVFIKLDSPQWKAWAAHPGRPIPLNKDGGWHFPSEWPPGGGQKRGAA